MSKVLRIVSFVGLVMLAYESKGMDYELCFKNDATDSMKVDVVRDDKTSIEERSESTTLSSGSEKRIHISPITQSTNSDDYDSIRITINPGMPDERHIFIKWQLVGMRTDFRIDSDSPSMTSEKLPVFLQCDTARGPMIVYTFFQNVLTPKEQRKRLEQLVKQGVKSPASLAIQSGLSKSEVTTSM